MLFAAWFACSPTLTAFCAEELRAAAETLALPLTIHTSPPFLADSGSPHAFCVFSTDNAASAERLSARCVLMRAVYALFAAADSVESLCAALREASDVAPSDAERHWLRGDCALCVGPDAALSVESVGRKYTLEEKSEIAVAVRSAVAQTQKQTVTECASEALSHTLVIVMEHDSPSEPPARIFFGSLVANSPRTRLLSSFALRTRPYIGTTTMPPEPAFLMAHMAGACAGRFVFDPFCGTGGVLLAAAACGAVTMGADMDGRAMRAGSAKFAASRQQRQHRAVAVAAHRAEDLAAAGIAVHGGGANHWSRECSGVSLAGNFRLHRLAPPHRLRMNFASWEGMWRGRACLDAIVTDPPYGIREPKAEAHDSDPQPLDAAMDLVRFAAAALVVGGRLVFWHATTDRYTRAEIPSHPSLRLCSDAAQRVSLKVVRRLIVMVKTAPLPVPPPSREQCAAQRRTEDLRALMDRTELSDNEAYTHYRDKLRRKREATAQYWAAREAEQSHRSLHGGGEEQSAQEEEEEEEEKEKGEALGMRQRPRLTRAERRDLVVANRERNIQRIKEENEKERKCSERND